MLWTSERRAEHPLAGQDTQHTSVTLMLQAMFHYMIVNIICLHQLLGLHNWGLIFWAIPEQLSKTYLAVILIIRL